MGRKLGSRQTLCKRGHVLEGNVYINAFDGRRRCKTCMKAYQKRKQIMRTGIYEPEVKYVKRDRPKIYNPAWPGVH